MSFAFNVLSYNIFCPVPEPFKLYGQTERVTRVKHVISELDHQYDLDAIVFNEVIAPIAQSTIFRDMKELGFIYHTAKLTQAFSVTGGTLIFSKYPILFQDMTVFGDKCVGIDCVAAKGVTFARIRKEKQYVNLCGVHLQAWQKVKASMVREQQMKQMGQFFESLSIPKHEPLLFCGDFNIDMYMDKMSLQHLVQELNMEIPRVSDDSHMFTVDPKENKLVGADDIDEYKSAKYPNGCSHEYFRDLVCPCCPEQWIDYTMFSNRHLRPLTSSMTSLRPQVATFQIKFGLTQQIQIQDTSDHYPVLGRFRFPVQTNFSTPVLQRQFPVDESNTSNLMLIGFALLSILGLIALVFSLLILPSIRKRIAPRKKIDTKHFINIQ